MIDRILEFSVRHRILMAVAAVIIIFAGVYAFKQLPIDAVPDVTTNQVQINTRALGLAPPEVEKLVTYPIESAVAGLPSVAQVRSLSNPGLSQVTVVFHDSVDIYSARQLVAERLATTRDALPAAAGTPVMGPVTTGLGEIFQYTLTSDKESPAALRTLQQFQIAPQLRSVDGVAEVNVSGGFEQQYQIQPDMSRMLAHHVTLAQLANAVRQNNANAGGAYIDQSDQELLVRGVGVARNAQDLADIVVASSNGIPTFVRDVANVTTGNGLRQGAATYDGKEAILGVVMMLKGANARSVAEAVDARLRQIRTELPPDVVLTTVYNRTTLVDRTIETVERNLVEGGLLVVAVLLLLLGNVRAALIVACVIPFAMLLTLFAMNQFGISANLLSLGALDFGMIVDGSVVLVENTVRRLAEARLLAGRRLHREEVAQTVLVSAREVGAPLTFGVAIIIVVYLPIMALTGIEGKMFRPMADTVAIALVAALVLSLTLIPALCAFGLSRDTRERSNKVLISMERGYRHVLELSMAHRVLVAILSVGFFIICAGLFPLLGSEFIPQLDEGSLSVTATRLPGSSIPYSVARVEAMERTILGFPEVKSVFTHLGTAEVATDPDPPNVSDSVVILRGRSHWPVGVTGSSLVGAMQDRLESDVPGQAYSFSQPIQMHTAELISGTRSDVAVKIFGDDTDTLYSIGRSVQSALRSVQGAKDVSLQQTNELPTLDIVVNRSAIARYGINVSDVQNVISSCVAGETLGQVAQGNRRFDIVLRLPDSQRNNITALKALPVTSPGGANIPLSELAQFIVRPSPGQIMRENGQRLVVVQANVRGRDLGSFVQAAQAAVAKSVALPVGYYITWGGEYQNLQSARARLLVVVPLALAVIFLLLFMAFGSIRQAGIIFTGVPLAVTGGVLALLARHLPFSITSGVGFIALFGVAVLNGIVLVSAINALRRDGHSVASAVNLGATSRLRPVLMTALVASLGFVPMAISNGVGAEVQRPLATVVIGGILSSTILTLVILPTLYAWFERNDKIAESID